MKNEMEFCNSLIAKVDHAFKKVNGVLNGKDLLTNEILSYLVDFKGQSVPASWEAIWRGTIS
jgi:hypothetical protein